ncbi:fibrous sheath-interacting protein 2 [Sorex fumeus]|uniref:fibrous sheath-interacting protein 2 n=1 Tax=Sorex fumeus TaxID=62283 RepID=UPI0024AD68BD|nr:fibrous sheath-interacting protein 2 [Sorex fumeus]
MDLYFSACSEAATVAATETAASSLATDSQRCGEGVHKTHFPGVGATQLLDLPLGVKLPMLPGGHAVYYTTKLSEKLFRPSYGFNLTDPYCRLLENQYKSLHDPHLKTYYKRKDILKRLKKGGYITSNNKIICSLRELNKYRQYLTSLKLDFERNYIKEQKMLSREVNKLQEYNQIPRQNTEQFQNWLLQENGQCAKDPERLLRHRYMDMINQELEQLERTAEEQRLLRMDREERQQREHTRRKLNLRRKMEEEWKTKEMLLLTKIGEDVKREARIEEQRRKIREESDRKKQALLEKKMAYHLQKMQENGLKREEIEKNAFDYKGQDEKYSELFNDLNYSNYNEFEPVSRQGELGARNQKLLENCLHEKVTSKELNSIIQNVMTWVVATVTSILYPAITKYEERLQNTSYRVSDDSVLSSDSSSFCSTCSDEFTYKSYTTATPKTFKRDPCTIAVDVSVRKPATPLKPPSARVERTIVKKNYHTPGQTITTQLECKKPKMICDEILLRKNDTTLIIPFDKEVKKSKDATTETDSLIGALLSDRKAKALNELEKLKNVFVNFKCYLKGETQLILESIFHELMSDLKQAIPSISSVTAEVFVDQCESEKEELSSNADVSAVASEIVDNILDKLHFAVEKRCVEISSQEEFSDNNTSNLVHSGENPTSSNGKPSRSPMSDIAEDIVHGILEKLMTLTYCNQNESHHIENATKLSEQINMFHEKTNKIKCNTEPDEANLIIKEEIQNLVSKIFSESSLVGHIEEAIGTILEYIQAELNNDRLFASEETIVLLQLLDDIFTELHKKAQKVNVQKCKHSMLRNSSVNEEKYRLTGTRLASSCQSGRPFSPINVPGMVLYSDDNNEEIENIVKSVINSSFIDEDKKSEEHTPENLFTKGNICFENRRNRKSPIKSARKSSRVAFSDRELKTDLPLFHSEDILEEKPCFNKDSTIFTQDQKHQIQKTSENTVKCILTEMLEDLSSVPPGYLDSNTGKKISFFPSEKPPGLSYQEWTDQMFSISEISTVVQKITDDILDILMRASDCIPNIIKSASSIHKNVQDKSDTHHKVEKAPKKEELHIWFDSETKMKCLSSFNLDPKDPSFLKFSENEPELIDGINDQIIDTVLKRLKLFICPKLQTTFKPSLMEQPAFQSQLSNYTTKVVNIVLHAIQNELELGKKSLKHRETDCTQSLSSKGYIYDHDELESLLSSIDDESMASPLLTSICQLLQGRQSAEGDTLFSSDKPVPGTSYGLAGTGKQNILPNRHNKKSLKNFFPTPCSFNSVSNGKENKENTTLQVLDSIGETLREMLRKIIGTHPHSLISCTDLNRERMKDDQQTTIELKSNIQCISQTILDCILAKLCNVNTDNSFTSPGCKAFLESPDTDSLSFVSITEEIGKCLEIISNIVSRMVLKGNTEVIKSMEKTTTLTSKTAETKVLHPNKLKDVALDILNVVFDNLERFANVNLENSYSIDDENKKFSEMKRESTNVLGDTNEGKMQFPLYMHAKKIAKTVLKAIQTELNMNSLDLRASIKNMAPERQVIKNIVNSILNAVSSGIFNETQPEETETNNFHYKPTYGNYLPGGGETNSNVEDAAQTEELNGERTLQREETQSNSLKQRILERTLSKIEVKLKEPQKSPVIPIVRNILNEIFQGALINQLNMLPVSNLSALPHNVNEPIVQTSIQFIDKTMSPLVSETDVTVVADDVVRTIFQKLFIAAMTERNTNESRYKTITFSTNVSFPEYTYGGNSSITILNKNPCTLQSRVTVDKQTKINVVEDIVKAVLTYLETFATLKVKSLFCHQINFTVSTPLPNQSDKSMVNKALSSKDSSSDDSLSCSLVDHITSQNTNSLSHLSLNKLNVHATEVARKILQGIKHELDKEMESPLITQNIVVSENIASQIVNTVLDIVSSKSKYDKSNSEIEIDSNHQEGIIEMFFNKTEYRNVLQFQIQDTIEGILCDIYEKTLYQNNLSFGNPTQKYNIDGEYSGMNSEMLIERSRGIAPKLSVPKSDVILISNDIIDIVLHNLRSAVMLGINPKDSTSVSFPLTICDMFPKTEWQQSLIVGSKNERKAVCIPPSRNIKSDLMDDKQITKIEKNNSKNSTHDICEENANFITKTIFNRLESFATERIDSLITLAFQSKEDSFVNRELEDCKQDDIVHESSQVESDVNVLKISTETLSTDLTFVNYREKLGPTVHLSQASLKEYADIIASVILKLIKNYSDLEIQKAYTYPNNTSFQENIIVSEIVNSILKILYDKKSDKEISFYSKHNPKLFSPQTSSDEILMGQKEDNAKVSLLSQHPLEKNKEILENESQKIVLEEIFMRNEETKQKDKTVFFSAVETVLYKVHQRIMEILYHLPSFSETPHLITNSKIRTDTTKKNVFQSQINSVANDILESILEKMYSVVLTSVYEYNKSREVETPDPDILFKKPPCIRENKEVKECNSTEYVVPQVYPHAGNQNASLFEKAPLQYSPSQVGKDLVQMVLSKITKFASFHLNESLCLNCHSEELLKNSKVNAKGNPRPGFKTNLKAKSKVNSSPKLKIRPHIGSSSAKVKNKAKLGPGEKTLKDTWSKPDVGLPHILSTGDAKNILQTKLPISELKMHASDIVIEILRQIVKEFERVKQARRLPSDKIIEANKIVNTILQGLRAANNHTIAHPVKFSHLDDLKHSQDIIGGGHLGKTQACFYLENVSSQLEQIFSKEGIFKKIDEWQSESNDKENEKCSLLMIAETILTEISIKAQDLEYPLSLLNLAHHYDCETRFDNHFRETSTRAEDTKTQINTFGRKIVELLFEKLQLCFLSQMPSPDSKETPVSRIKHFATKSKFSFPTKGTLSNVPVYNKNMKNEIYLGASNQIIQEIVEKVLNLLESFVDLQFKRISKYAISEIVKMPIENLFPVQQRLLSKKMLPKAQQLKKFDESKSNNIYKEDIENTLLEVHLFHSELLTYAINIVTDMLALLKNKLDREISQEEPSSVSILKENIAASSIIGSLISHCAHFRESLIKDLPKETLFQGVENTYIVNHVEFASDLKIPISKLKEGSLENNLSCNNRPSLIFISDEDMKSRYRSLSALPAYGKTSVENKIKSSEPMQRPESQHIPSCSQYNLQDYSPRSDFGPYNPDVKRNSCPPEGSILQKLFKKANESTDTALKDVMAFIEVGKSENPRVFHYESLNSVTVPNHIETTVSPLKICLAAENIVNTVLSSYGFPSQLHTNENMETIKPFFTSKQKPFSVLPGKQMNEDKSLLRMCDKRIRYTSEEENIKVEIKGENIPLLHKWKTNLYPKIKTVKELDVLAFSDHELGPNEIHLLAKHVTTSVITHFKNLKSRVFSETTMSIIPTLSRKNYESKQPSRNIYNDSSLYQLCEHLSDSVISHLISNISDITKDDSEKKKTQKSQDKVCNKIISVDSQLFENKTTSIGELALRISDIITGILLNCNIIQDNMSQKHFSLRKKYVYCPEIFAADFNDLFQDILIGIIDVLSKEIGLNCHLEENGRGSFPMLSNFCVPVCNETNPMERQKMSTDWKSSTHQLDRIIKKNKLNYLAYKLDNLVGNLKNQESKEIVNKVFNIVVDLFLPDENQNEVTDSDKVARTFFLSSNDCMPGNNLGLTSKSVFLLNVVCEKLIRTLLEKCTNTLYENLDNGALSIETSEEQCQLLEMFHSVEDEEFDYQKRIRDCEQFQEYYMSDFLGNLAEMNQDLLLSDSLLTDISHNLVKSLMDSLSHSIECPQGPPPANKHLKYRTREINSNFIKTKNPELTELTQDKGSIRFTNDKHFALRDSLGDGIKRRDSKISVPFGKKYSLKLPNLSHINRKGLNNMDTQANQNQLYLGEMNTSTYSATFLEEIISGLFFNLSISLWGQNEHITVTRLNEMNTSFINKVVNLFNNAQVTVLRNADEKLCCPPFHKQIVSRIVDSVYYDVLQQYKLEATCGGNLAHGNTSIVEQIANDILLEVLDYQLPTCLRAKLTSSSYHPLSAEVILEKLQSKLKEFTFQHEVSRYSTMLSSSFLEDIIRRLLPQLIPPPKKTSSLGKSSHLNKDFNEMFTYVVDKVKSAISKHKILFTIYDNQCLYSEKYLQKMVDSVYSNIVQMDDSLVSLQKSIVSQCPIMVDQIASLIIQEIIENHLQPFLQGEDLSRPKSPLDAISNMVKQVISESIDSQKPSKLSHLGVYPDKFVEEIVARLLSKIFNTRHNTETDMENMSQKLVKSINRHFGRTETHIVNDDREQCYPSVDNDIVDELVTSVYVNVLKQQGLHPEVDEAPGNSDIFVENITNLVVEAISDYLLHPLFSGDSSTSSYSISAAENIVHSIIDNVSKSTKTSQNLSPYNTLLPYTFLEDMVRGLLYRIFPSASNISIKEIPKERSNDNFNEIASKLISNIRTKISQHEIRFSKDEEAKCVYSEDEVQHLVDSVFKNISQNPEFEESPEQNITSVNDDLIDRIAGFIIKHICQKHLLPFVGRKQLTSSDKHCDARKNCFYANSYSSTFLEDVVSGILSRIFHRALGIVQTKPLRDSDDELFDKAEKLIHLIAEEFSKAEVSIIENAEEKYCLPPVAKEDVKNVIDKVYSKVLQEYEMEILPDKDFLSDTKTLAARITKIILTECFGFQIHANIIAKLPFKSHSKLNTDALIKRLQCDIVKSKHRRQSPTIYTTMLSHSDLEKIVTQLMSHMNPLACSTEHSEISQSDFNNKVIKLITEIMSIISNHAICITNHGNEQNLISEKDIQSMVDSIYADLSYSNTYRSLTKDKKGVSSIPVSKTASFIIKEIFNHHLQSFSSENKTCFSGTIDQTSKKTTKDPKQKELSFIVNSTFFFEQVISELLGKLFYAFSQNVLAAENPNTVKVQITDIVTTLVKSIILEFTRSEILLADNFDKAMCFSELYKDMVKKTVNLIYEKILDEYQSMAHIHMAMQCDTVCFGKKIYHLLLEKMYDYQVESLVSEELISSSYSSLKADNIIKNVVNNVMKDGHVLPSCVTVLSRPVLEDMICKLLVHLFPSTNIETKSDKEEIYSDYEFMDAASKLTDEIIEEISEHEIHLAVAEQNAESVQLDEIEDFVDSICNNILKKSEFEVEIQKSKTKKGDSCLTKIAGFIIKEIMDHHLQPFLHDEKSSSVNLPDSSNVSILTKHGKEKKHPSLYSAKFLEDVVVNLVHKFYCLPSKIEDSEKKEMAEPDTVGLAMKFVNSLIEEFRKSEIKVLPNAEEKFSFPSIDKKTVDMVSNFVYDQFIGKYGSSNVQNDNKNNSFIENVASLLQKAISTFKIQTLFSGDWSSTFFAFLNPDNITERVQNLSQKIPTEVSECLKGDQFTLPEKPQKHISLTSDQKNLLNPLRTDRNKPSKKKSFKTEKTSTKKSDNQDLKCTSITSIMKRKMVSLLSGSASGMANKKHNENRTEIPSQKDETASEVTCANASVKSEAIPEQNLIVTVENNRPEKKVENNKSEKRSITAFKKEQQVTGEYEQAFTNDTGSNKDAYESVSVIGNEKINKRQISLKKDDKSSELAVVPQMNDKQTTTEPMLEAVPQEVDSMDRKDFYVDTLDDLYSDYEHVQNVTENIYDNVLKMYHSQETVNSRTKSFPRDTASLSTQVSVRDFEQFVTAENLQPSVNQHATDKEEQMRQERELEEKEKIKVKEIKNEPIKNDNLQYSSKSKPGIFPAKFLEDVITEMIRKLIFSSSPETKTYKSENEKDDEIQTELYNTAIQLFETLLKEFTDAQIKVFSPDKESQSVSPVGKLSVIPKLPPTNTDESSFSMSKKLSVNKMSNMHKMSKKPASNRRSFLDKISKIDKTLVNKIVHSSICNILKEFKSQDSICKNIKSNGEKFAKRLTSAMIDEIFRHKLDSLFCDEVLASECLPLESKDVVKTIQKMVQTVSKECQTSSPYTIMLNHEFLDNMISALLSKIFSSVYNAKAETSEDDWFTELDFLQIKLVSTIKAEISKDDDIIIQYVECLHPNDDEIIKVVIDSIYNNLLSQFGSRDIIRNCVSTGCKILSETIVDLVLREVTGNQLQNYFSGELTPHQCAEVDSVVENILKGVIQTVSTPQNRLSHCHALPYNIIEEIAIKFLAKLLSMFPKAEKEKSKSLEIEMQNIASKILNSLQDFISKSKIKLVPPVKELLTTNSANNAIIEKVVDSVYTQVLKHSGSLTSLFKDLMGKSNVLSDIIGFLMIKEVAKSEFQPQVEEASSSQLVLEAVKIIEKVIKIVDEHKSPDKSLSKKGVRLDITFLEEALALFLAKVLKLPSASSKEEKKLSKTELNKIASQLTKSVTAEISESNISLITSDPEEHILNSESIEIISHVIDTVYSKVLQQSGNQKQFYDDIRETNNVFPKKVASLIIQSVSNISLDTILPTSSSVLSDLDSSSILSDLDMSRIIEKAEEHADNMSPQEDRYSDIFLTENDLEVKIIPHIGKRPLKIDPDIISEHLAVISVKTLPLEKLKKECLRTTGHSITELRKASISGKSYQISALSVEKLKKERRISLDRTGRLDIKPLEAVCRNSFQNIRKPDITKVELLKDVHSKKDLIIRLVAHDIDQEEFERTDDSDEDEIIIREILQEDFEEPFEMKEAMKPIENKSISPRTMLSSCNLKKMLSLSRCCQSTSSVNIKNIDTSLSSIPETKDEEIKKALLELHTDRRSTALAHIHLASEKKLQSKKEENTEPTHYLIHRIMSTSSYNQEDLISSAGETEDSSRDTSAKISEDSSQKQQPDNLNNVQFITLFGGNEKVIGGMYSSKHFSETMKPNVPKQGSKMLAKVSSALSKVFSQTNTNISKSPSSPHQEEN